MGSPTKVRGSPTTWRLTRCDDEDGSAWRTADGGPYDKRFASFWTGGETCGCRQTEPVSTQPVASAELAPNRSKADPKNREVVTRVTALRATITRE
jgi:hypothetical protein